MGDLRAAPSRGKGLAISARVCALAHGRAFAHSRAGQEAAGSAGSPLLEPPSRDSPPPPRRDRAPPYAPYDRSRRHAGARPLRRRGGGGGGKRAILSRLATRRLLWRAQLPPDRASPLCRADEIITGASPRGRGPVVALSRENRRKPPVRLMAARAGANDGRSLTRRLIIKRLAADRSASRLR